MTDYRRLYNRMLELKFKMLELNREDLKDSFDIINEQLQDLDDLATRKNHSYTDHREFITGSNKLNH